MSYCDRWVCVVDSPKSGIENMRVDLALLNNLEKCSERMTFLRFYDWNVPTVSLGKHQQIEGAVDLHYCQKFEIPIVHRPTGGQAVFHDCELTYSVVSNDPHWFPFSSIRETYRLIAVGLQKGIGKLGISTQLVEGVRKSKGLLVNQHAVPCFVTPSRCEILCEGRKIAGSSQRRLKRSFLQHGSMPLQVNYSRMASSLGVPEELLRTSLISVSEALGRGVNWQTVCEALKIGFEQTFQVKLHMGKLAEYT